MARTSDLSSAAYFKVLACVARADGVVRPDEAALLGTVLDGLGLLPADREALERLLDVSTVLDVDATLRQATSTAGPEHLVDLLRDAYLVAGIDHEVAPAEVEVVERLLAAVGVAAEKRPALHEWARRCAEHHVDGLLLVAGALALPAPV